MKATSALGAAALALVLTSTLSPATGATASPATASAAAGMAPAADETVQVDQPTRLEGRMPGARRRVVLQEKFDNGWRGVAHTRSSRKGRFSLKVPTWWYGEHRVRAVAPRTGKRPQAVRGTRTVTVATPYIPAGLPSEYAPYDVRARWNPCTTITWAYNPGATDAATLAMVTSFVGEVERASGIRFRYVGTTSLIPFTYDVRRKKAPADVVVAWTSAAVLPVLTGSVSGFGGGTYGYDQRRNGKLTGAREITNGGVALDQEDILQSTTPATSNPLWGSLVMHEFGHVLGLDHVPASPSQLMYPIIDTAGMTNLTYGAGDLAGLRKMGGQRGCYPESHRR